MYVTCQTAGAEEEIGIRGMPEHGLNIIVSLSRYR